MQDLERALQDAYFADVYNLDYPESRLRKAEKILYGRLPKSYVLSNPIQRKMAKRNYQGAFYPIPDAPRMLVRAANPVYGMTQAQRERKARQRALAMRKRGIRPFIPGNMVQSVHEVKCVDVPQTTSFFGTGPNIVPVNLIQSGSGFFNRVGRKISMKSLHFRGYMKTFRTINNEDLGRILVIYDRQTNGVIPVLTDILANIDQAGATTATTCSGINMNYRDRFSILRDIHIYLPTETDTAGVITNTGIPDQNNQFGCVNFHLLLKGLVTQYGADSNPAVIGDVRSGGLYLVFIGDQTNATAGWTITWETRLRYDDN